MRRLTNCGRNTGSHLHPIPGQHFCARLSPCVPSWPLEAPSHHHAPNHNVGNSGERPRSGLFQAGQAKMMLTPPKKKFWEISMALGLPPVPPAKPWHGYGASAQAAPAAPQPTSPVKPLHITSLMLMDFSLMPQIKVIGLGWPMNPAELGRRRERPCRD